jgi:UDP-N-acetylmuramoyl-L-alanyl-D-glutamate--2,6-diaminopimelate ligase
MLKEGAKYAVIEVSSHSLVQKRVLGIDFHRAIFTNLTRDHLDFHKTPNQYKQAKAILFRNLSSDSIAILNADDPASKYYAGKTPAQTIWYRIAGRSSKMKLPSTTPVIQAEIKESSLHGNTFLLKTPIGETTIQSPLIGQHNIYNILAAAATAVSLGIPVDTIKDGIEQFKTMKGRTETIPTNTGYTVMVDFGHTEDALKNVLLSLKPLVKGRIITVFGCGGDRDKGKRPLMGRVVSKLSDLFVITSDNPRSEDPLKIIKDIKKGIRRKDGYYVEPDRYEAIKKTLSLARPGDLVLIAGKGHETYQIFKDTVKPFDDRAVVKQLLQ